MKAYLWLFFSLVLSAAQSQVTDDFSDGDFTVNPSWSGDGADFNVDAGGRLHLNALSGGDSYLSLSVVPFSDSAEWRFKISLDFSPSSSNYCRVYLSSDQQNLQTPLNGYFLQFGEALSNDAIELFRQDGTTVTSICRATNGQIANAFDVSVKVNRYANGDWNIFTDYSGNENYSLDATGNDTVYPNENFFGVSCVYTASNSDRYYFDDFYIGEIIRDTIAPAIVNLNANSDSSLVIRFSEAVENISATDLNNYYVNNGIGNPSAIERDSVSANSFILKFNQHFQNQSYQLNVINVQDVEGNIIQQMNYTFQYSPLIEAGKSDVIISEIYFETSSSSPLPNAEFVEVYNRKDSDVQMDGWIITDGSSDGNISAFILHAHEYAILCDENDVSLFAQFQNVIGVNDFPTLNNDVGDDLKLINSSGVVIDELKFSNENYHSTTKDDGGWTIERVDNDFTCENDNNWKASVASLHGTPGQTNSVRGGFSDHDQPFISNAYFSDSSEVTIIFSEPIETGAEDPNNYHLLKPDGSSFSPVQIVLSSTNDTAILRFSSVLNHDTYSVQINSSLKDCPGNEFRNEEYKVGFPEMAVAGDVLINELMYYCKSGSTDFVEIYNASGKIIDLKDWIISEADYVNEYDIKEDAKISLGHRLFFPGEYIVLSESNALIKDFYECKNDKGFIDVESMPDYSSDEGRVIIFDNGGNKIDAFRYNDKMQFMLLDDPRGVSLERMSLAEKEDKETNWHSAAATAGFATPGYENSQRETLFSGGNEVQVGKEIISPDDDGYDDVLTIHYSFKQSGTVLSLNVYNYEGRLVATVLNSETVSMDGDIFWNGYDNNNAVADEGVYVLLGESFDLKGNQKIFRKAIVVAKK